MVALSRFPAFFLRPALAVLDTLAPRHCLACGEALAESPASVSDSVCARCHDSFTPAPHPNILTNRLFTGFDDEDSVIASFPADDIALTSITALYQFGSQQFGSTNEEGVSFAEVVYALKYRGHFQLGEDFGRELGKLLQRSAAFSSATYNAYDAIVPVPLHHVRERERGFNQADAIALGVASVLGVAIEPRWIRRHEITASQTLLSGTERRTNVRTAFTAHRSLGDMASFKKSRWRTPATTVVGGEGQSLRGKSVLLVDDVYTTGATLNACANALLTLGARRVDAAVLASA
jgi:predicted amidophosphoribosyltransferase